MLLRQVKSILQVVVSVGLFQLVKVDQIRPENKKQMQLYLHNTAGQGLKSETVKVVSIIFRQLMMMMMMKMLPVFVDEGVEGHAVSPAGGEIVDIHVWIPDDKQRTHLLLKLQSVILEEAC